MPDPVDVAACHPCLTERGLPTSGEGLVAYLEDRGWLPGEKTAACQEPGCEDRAEWTLWANDDAGNRIAEENLCCEHVMAFLRRHADKQVPWPLYGPTSLVPWRLVPATEALRLLGEAY